MVALEEQPLGCYPRGRDRLFVGINVALACVHNGVNDRLITGAVRPKPDGVVRVGVQIVDANRVILSGMPERHDQQAARGTLEPGYARAVLALSV
jgi:hypothetical protein